MKIKVTSDLAVLCWGKCISKSCLKCWQFSAQKWTGCHYLGFYEQL